MESVLSDVLFGFLNKVLAIDNVRKNSLEPAMGKQVQNSEARTVCGCLCVRAACEWSKVGAKSRLRNEGVLQLCGRAVLACFFAFSSQKTWQYGTTHKATYLIARAQRRQSNKSPQTAATRRWAIILAVVGFLAALFFLGLLKIQRNCREEEGGTQKPWQAGAKRNPLGRLNSFLYN